MTIDKYFNKVSTYAHEISKLILLQQFLNLE